MTSSHPALLHTAIVAEVRSQLGVLGGRVLPAPTADTGAILVEHIADATGLPWVGTLPAADEIGDLSLRPADAADIVVVDWLTAQVDRRGSHVAVLGRRAPYRVAGIVDDAAFAETESFDRWIRSPGAPLGLARYATAEQDRVEELATRADDVADGLLRWIDALGSSTDDDVCLAAAAIFEDHLIDLLAGEIDLTEV